MTNQCNISEKSVLITIDDGYQAVHRYMLPILKRLHLNATSFVVTSRITEIAEPWSIDPRPLLGWDQIASVRKNYPHVEFHSHSHDQHRMVDGKPMPPLTEYADILTDVQMASTLLGSDVYAYPFGRVTDTIVQVLQDAGYRMAFVVGEGIHAQPGMDLYRIPRYAIKSSTTLHDFTQLLDDMN